MSGSRARSLVAIAVAAAIAPFGVGTIGGAAAESSALRISALANRYESPVSETDVGRADHQPAGSIERGETPAVDSSRIFQAR